MIVQSAAVVAWTAAQRLGSRRWHQQHPVLTEGSISAEGVARVVDAIASDFRVEAEVVVERLALAVGLEAIIHAGLAVKVQHLERLGLRAARQRVVAVAQVIFGRHVE